MSNIHILQTPTLPIEEPDWNAVIPDQGRGKAGSNAHLRALAGEYWREITAALSRAGTLAPENVPMVKRLALAYVRYDRATAELFKGGLVTEAPVTGTAKANIWRTELRSAAEAALALESELCLSPRRRSAATKAKRPDGSAAASAADSYLDKPRR